MGARPFEWSETTVTKILEDEIYLGHTISLRYTTQSYKNKRRIERPEMICTPFTGHPVEGVLLCGTHMSTKGNV